MLDFFKKKTKGVLPIEINKEEKSWEPIIKDQELLNQKREELRQLVAKAAEDEMITLEEYEQLRELTIQVGVNDAALADMVTAEYKRHLKEKVILFISDGSINEVEMKVLVTRADEIGISRNELQMFVNEALCEYEQQEKERKEKAAKLRIQKNEEEKKRIEEKEEEEKRTTTKRIAIVSSIFGAAIIGAAAVATKIFIDEL